MRSYETFEEMDAREKRFNEAKRMYNFYDTGLGSVIPDARDKRYDALLLMWENAYAPSRSEIRKRTRNEVTNRRSR